MRATACGGVSGVDDCSVVTDVELRELHGLTALTELTLSYGPNATHAGLQHLTSLTAPTSLGAHVGGAHS